MNTEQKTSKPFSRVNLKDELNRLKTSQIRIERINKIHKFYEEMHSAIDRIDEFASYKEDYENNHILYKEEFEKYVLPLAGNVNYEFEAAITRAQEKNIVIKESIRFIMLCLSATTNPKRICKTKDNIIKITKGRLIDSLKELERYTLSITLWSPGFQSQFFDEIQQLRIAFLHDAINQVLEFADIKREFVPLIFDQLLATKLEETLHCTRSNSITKYYKINENDIHWTESFKMLFIDRFLLQIEDAMKRSPRV
ncbi:hypothetical protein OM416_19630 [Paenibacillus sp. LS1]|uniref:hypothetical protein n=1 Tax=Paenibacillus sp. LS1 TaxID=2992120 RepID=UPI0022324BFF|nr:hypothetical protein [Paenibacillus sp. LS1]MCW3793807.1 hypothetical protein [Paenibacillus sp. LS1]